MSQLVLIVWFLKVGYFVLLLQLTAEQLVLLLELLLEEPQQSVASMHALHKIYNLHGQDAEVRPCTHVKTHAHMLRQVSVCIRAPQSPPVMKVEADWCVVNSLVIGKLNPTTIHFMFSAEQRSLLVLLTVFLSVLCVNSGKVCYFKVPSPRIQQLKWENISAPEPVNHLYFPPIVNTWRIFKRKIWYIFSF